jgi:hypothetical protein
MAKSSSGMLSPQIRNMLALCPPLGISFKARHLNNNNLMLPHIRVMTCAFAPSGNLVACG